MENDGDGDGDDGRHDCGWMMIVMVLVADDVMVMAKCGDGGDKVPALNPANMRWFTVHE